MWRMLARIRADPPSAGWRIKPTPSLFAEPSRPSAIIFKPKVSMLGIIVIDVTSKFAKESKRTGSEPRAYTLLQVCMRARKFPVP